MRIDKYLWCIRLFKTRNLATEACKKGAVKINGTAVKPAREVLTLDKISVRKNQIEYQITAIAFPESRVGAKLVGLYAQDNTPAEAFAHSELQRLAQEYYRKKGEGRPTKKDRRDLDDWFESEPSWNDEFDNELDA